MIRMRDVIEMSHVNLRSICASPQELQELRAKIISGDVVIVRSVISEAAVRSFLEDVQNSNTPLSDSPEIREGTKNIRYISNYTATKEGAYSTRDQSWYFFPWNSDELKVMERFQHIYNDVLLLNERIPHEVVKQTPKDGVIQRFHLIHYPPEFGEITMHVDPDNIAKINAGIYPTQYGVDYEDGGFFAVNAAGEEICVDRLVRAGDMVLFNPSMIHGVRRIKSIANQKAKNIAVGRYFFNMTLVESHEVSQRKRTIGVEV